MNNEEVKKIMDPYVGQETISGFSVLRGASFTVYHYGGVSAWLKTHIETEFPRIDVVWHNRKETNEMIEKLRYYLKERGELRKGRR